MRVKKIEPDTAVPVTLTLRDKELIADHTFADSGYIAAEANHSKNRKLKKELDGLWERLNNLMRSYDDGGWG